MPTSCSVIGCKSRANAGPKKQFFRFPQKRPKVLQQWLMVLDRLDWTPKPSSKICSDHFAPEDFLYRPNVSNPRLKPEAVPSIFPDPSSAQEEAVEPDEINNTENDDIENSEPPVKIESNNVQKQENVNENSMKQSGDDVHSTRPRRTSKINVKMKDFILLDDFRKLNKPETPKNKQANKGDELPIKKKSPEISDVSDNLSPKENSETSSKTVTPKDVGVSKVDAAKELLSILEDSDEESLQSLQNKNDLLNIDESLTSSSKNSSPDNRSPLIRKDQLKKDSPRPLKKFQSAFKPKKKLSHSGVNIAEIASRTKSVSCPIRFAPGRTDVVQPVDAKTLKQKARSVDSIALLEGKNELAAKVPYHITKTKGSVSTENPSFLDNEEASNLTANTTSVKFPSRMRTKRPSTDLAKTYFPIRCGENFFYFSYADLNPVVDLSKNNVLMETHSKEINEGAVSANKNEPQLIKKLKRRIEELVAINENRINEPKVQLEESSYPCEEGAVAQSGNENDDTSTELDDASESNGTSATELTNSKEDSAHNNVISESVSDVRDSSENVLPDDNKELEDSELQASPAKKRKKRFKTVAEIVVRTDNTKPGEAPNVSIDRINKLSKLVDFTTTKTSPRITRKGNKPTNEATSSVDVNDNLSHITLSSEMESSEEELGRLAERITDTIKQMKLLDKVKGNSSKLTVLITTLPPVKEKEILIIKKKNTETNIVQSKELQVVISSNKANESSLQGNIVVTNPIGYAILPAGKNMPSIASNDGSNTSEERVNSGGDQEHNIVHFQDRVNNKEASGPDSIPVGNSGSLGTPNDTMVDGDDNENNSSGAIIHDHPYISPNVKYLLANPNVSINLSEVQSKETPSKMKLSENEIIFRNKVSKKLRSLKENIQKKNDAISKLKEKIKYLERNLKEVKRNRKNPLKAMKKEGASILKNDIFYGVQQLVDTSDFSNTMDYGLTNIELPLGLDENGEESDDDGERECASPITYLCEPAIEVPNKDRETAN